MKLKKKGILQNTWATRLTLIARARDPKDEGAWMEFVEYYKDFIDLVILKLGLKGAESDDLTQETLLSIWKTLPQFQYDQDKAKFRTWLSRIIKNKLIDHYRKRNTQEKLKQGFSEEQAHDTELSSSEIDQLIEKEWEVQLIKTGLKRIAKNYSPQSLEVFQMAMNGMSDTEIAEELDMQPNSVNKLKNRIKKKLSAEIESLRHELEHA